MLSASLNKTFISLHAIQCTTDTINSKNNVFLKRIYVSTHFQVSDTPAKRGTESGMANDCVRARGGGERGVRGGNGGGKNNTYLFSFVIHFGQQFFYFAALHADLLHHAIEMRREPVPLFLEPPGDAATSLGSSRRRSLRPVQRTHVGHHHHTQDEHGQSSHYDDYYGIIPLHRVVLFYNS